jgi:lipopolysaccharide transport system ATP-binding protein
MPPAPAISVRNLSKSYVIGHQRYRRYATLRDEIATRAGAMARTVLRTATPQAEPPAREEFWALDDVSFDVERGDRLGVIGRNGAGKSTLLKVLSRITEPTRGRAEIRGRVASLLEVGTGFHPELTGRENIFLNGAILGMTRREIRARFDQIVAFAEVERFLDTPVKHYSSGMYVRLAFAVAAHLQTDILIVDEVLAVGDAEFQRRCLGRMRDVADEGRTILFVSHNMAAVAALCTHAMFLDKGSCVQFGGAKEVTQRYLVDTLREDAHGARYVAPDGRERAGVALLEARVDSPRPGSELHVGDAFEIEIVYRLARPKRGIRAGFRLETAEGVVVCGANDGELSEDASREAGVHRARCRVEGARLNSGTYFVTIGIDEPPYTSALFLETNCIRFEVQDLDGYGSNFGRAPGVIRPETRWAAQR